MSLAQLVKSHYTNKFRGVNLKQIVLPQGAAGEEKCIGATVTAGAAVTTWGVWVDVAVKALIDTDTLVVGVVVDSPSATGVEIWTIDIGNTLSVDADGAVFNYPAANDINTSGVLAAIAVAHRAEIRFEIAGNTGIFQPVMLEYPILIPRRVGILARGYTVSGSDGGADTIGVSVLCVQYFEGRMI